MTPFRLAHPLLLLSALALACQGNTTAPSASGAASDPAPGPADAAEPPAAGEPVHVPAPTAEPETTPTAPDSEAGEAPPAPDPGEEAKTTPPKKKVARPQAGRDEVTCEDGKRKAKERWKVDCNECWCTDDGKVMCTRMACK